MKQYLVLFALIFITSLICAADLGSPVGKWKTIDDKTGRVKSIVLITEKDGALYGKIIQVFRLPEEDQDPVCDKCPGEKKNKKAVGLEIMWGMKKDDDEWNGGKLLDPENGETYKGKLKLTDGGKKLDVRGYIGISLFGRTQTWERVE